MDYALLNKKRVFGFSNQDQFLDFIEKKNKILIAINAEKLLLENPEIIKLINENIGYPDGIGAVLALRRKGIKSIKIAGAGVWLKIVEKFYKEKNFFLIGSSQSVIEETVKKLGINYPEINIVGFRNGFFDEHEREIIINEIVNLKPNIIFVALGSPKQEYFMSDLIKRHSAIYMGLGGSFDVYSGNKKRAPKIYQKFGLEWFYRLLKEPTRINRQKNLLLFFIKLITNKF